MTRSNSAYEHTIAFAEQAIGRIRNHRTSAYPRSYELWYSYVTAHNTALNKAINAVLERHGSISEQELDEIYDAYLSPLRFADRVDQTGSALMGEISQVRSYIDGAVGEIASYGETLHEAVPTLLASQDDRAKLRHVVETLVEKTQAMEASNIELQRRLLESRDEIQQLQESLKAVRTESLTDPLTSLANRKAFDIAFSQALTNARTSRDPLVLLITDIDHFKRFNDSYGHLTGDQVLRLVAMAMKQNLKGADIAARFGGEEFAVVLPGTSLRSGLTVADHIRRAVMSKELVKRSTGENLGRVTISIGVATFRAGDTEQTLIERADACLYAAKRGGRNRVVCETDPDIEAASAAVA